MTPRQQVLHVARQRTYGSRLPTLRYIRSFTRSRGGAWGNPDGGWEHQGVACRASMAGAAWDERSGSVHLHGILTDQLLEVAEAGAARSARLASTTMMIRPGVPPALPVAVPRRSLLWLSLPRRRSVHVHACVLLYYTALTCNNNRTRTAYSTGLRPSCCCARGVRDTIKYNSW